MPPVTAPSEARSLTSARRAQAFLYGGLLLFLVNFSSPAAGMLDIPVTFFLKNRMHLPAHALAVFKLWVGAPLFLGFVFGFLRDRWSPFGRGDRAHLLVFCVTTAAIYSVLALVAPSYRGFLLGLVVATMAYRMVSSAAYGITSAIARKHAVTGQMSSIIGAAENGPLLLSFVAGGKLSETLEGHSADAAARILFFCAAGLMLSIAVLGLVGPGWMFREARDDTPRVDFVGDLKRIVRHGPIYPVMLVQLLWQFSPATGTVLQYHIVDTLHATDAQWGLWQGIFFGSFLPVYAGYGFLCRRFALLGLLWVGFVIAVLQMIPLLFVHTAAGALIAAAPMGVMGGLAQAALVDLVIRSSPAGMESTVMMLFQAGYYFSIRFGDLFGTWIYDAHGGFVPAVVITIGIYALILPVLTLVPKRLTATADGEALVAGTE